MGVPAKLHFRDQGDVLEKRHYEEPLFQAAGIYWGSVSLARFAWALLPPGRTVFRTLLRCCKHFANCVYYTRRNPKHLKVDL